jgi:two-component system nitrate/nitrite response regulator NarL
MAPSLAAEPAVRAVVAEASPLISRSMAQRLLDECGLDAWAAAGSLDEAIEECARRRPCVLVAGGRLLEKVDAQIFPRLVDWGRRVPVLALLPAGAGTGDAAVWLRLGCMGCIGVQESASRMKRALEAVAAGQMWAPRAVLAGLLREALCPREPGCRLTPREQEILHLMAAGSSKTEIAARLFISMETVRWHVRRLAAKTRNYRSEAAPCSAGRSEPPRGWNFPPSVPHRGV